MIELDTEWLAAHPLPDPAQASDKNARGRLLAAGGSLTVPAALLLTGEAAFRVGAGKVQLASVEPAMLGLGLRFPEAAVLTLPVNDEGEMAGDAGAAIAGLVERCDALVLGPGMGMDAEAAAILAGLLDAAPEVPMLLDAAMLAAVGDAQAQVLAASAPIVLTPHPGEAAALMDCDPDDVCAELAEAAAARFGATVVLKSPQTWIATPGEPTLTYRGGGPGLATGGSGDVLAGIIGGLLARGVAPHVASAWGVWLHGKAGRILGERIGPIGFLARELLPLLPGLMEQPFGES
ncbi:NAD(P)H-hydrate dehydratase [Sphingomonas turrisvirgatae]|uniref:ADP-dependent (S)-NAD(P)H-hydrate dehydratase n=1 Tax=Sphingomonas turrisvirgatae TaxID=1888892 RepID=A0A1E3M0G3_9SPHN|nr:NAD(P)H-hydrate dehydratase [Sphingomonas turrisvirgatae]ODP39516.1 NAD(P)H-hydrate dehydratase [Sphingomonas turrisvirgatae]